MTVNRTTLLDLPLPVTGTESGTWGDTTNNGLTQYMDIAIAGMSNLTSANFTTGALTIETTEGNSSATNITATSGQYAGFRVTSLAQNSTITVGNTGTNPARSYRLINADATYTLTFKATGQTGITLQPGQTAVVAFNGTDYVIVGMAGAGTVTDNAVVRFDGTTGKLVQNSVVTIADSTGDVAGVGALTMGGNLTLNGGTANGVLYLNGSKVATSGSALTFDGTNLGVGATVSANTTYPGLFLDYGVSLTGWAASTLLSFNSYNVGTQLKYRSSGLYGGFRIDGDYFTWSNAVSGSANANITQNELMRLTSTGLGIGTSSPAYKLHVQNSAANTDTFVGQSSTVGLFTQWRYNATAANAYGEISTYGGSNSVYIQGQSGGGNTILNLQSGNVGIGTSSPTSKLYVTASVASTAIAAFFNTDTANGNGVYIKAGGANAGKYALVIDNAASSSLLYLDPSGNLGLGVTPSAWSVAKGFEIASPAGITSAGTGLNVGTNTYFNGSNWIYKTSAAATLAVQTNGTHYWSIAASGTAGNTISFTQAMTLDASGNLLVGMTSASFASGGGINVKNASTSNVRIIGGSSTGFDLSQDTGGNTYVYNRDNGFMAFATNNTERARITSGGEFQLGTGGTASANVRSLINGSSTTGYGGYIEFQNDGSAFAAVGDYKALGGGGSTALLLCKNSTGGVYLATSGATSWSAVSDENKKNIIENISDAAAKVSSLRAVIGTYKDDPNAERHPFLIAQDVQAVLPEAVTDNEGVLGLSYSDVIPLLVAAIKEQQALITSLTARVALLEGN